LMTSHQASLTSAACAPLQDRTSCIGPRSSQRDRVHSTVYIISICRALVVITCQSKPGALQFHHVVQQLPTPPLRRHKSPTHLAIWQATTAKLTTSGTYHSASTILSITRKFSLSLYTSDTGGFTGSPRSSAAGPGASSAASFRPRWDPAPPAPPPRPPRPSRPRTPCPRGPSGRARSRPR